MGSALTLTNIFPHAHESGEEFNYPICLSRIDDQAPAVPPNWRSEYASRLYRDNFSLNPPQRTSLHAFYDGSLRIAGVLRFTRSCCLRVNILNRELETLYLQSLDRALLVTTARC